MLQQDHVSLRRVIFAFWGMARPSQVLAVILVYLTGALMAQAFGAMLDVTRLLWGLAALLPVTFSIHYANEYADYETDALTNRTPFSGGSGLSVLVPRAWIITGARWTLLTGLFIALVGLLTGLLYPAALLLLVIGAFGGWMYSLPPLQLAWRGWGELDNALLGGMVLPLYGYAALMGQIDALAVLACVPFTALVFVNLLATTWADREADATVGKYTLATRWHISRLRWLYYGAAFLAFLMLLLASQFLPGVLLFGSLFVVPVVAWGALTFTRIHSPFPTVLAMILMMVVQLGGWFFAGS